MPARRALIPLNLDSDLLETVLGDEDGEEPIRSIAVLPDGSFATLRTGPWVSDPLALKSAKPALERMNQTERNEAVQCLLFRFVHGGSR